MDNKQKIIECVPNISEGNDLPVLMKLQKVIQSIEGVKLLHVDIGKAANRTVFTFAGMPERVTEAAFQLIKIAANLIYMRHHKGIHPRIGAVDVCPLVPIRNITLNEVSIHSRKLSARVGDELGLSVYCYEESAFSDYKRKLENIRKGEYEGLDKKIKFPEWKPDFGPDVFNPAFGAIVIGARNILLAYNINLDTRDVTIAKSIAEQIRESGKLVIYEGISKRQTFPTTMKYVKAIGWIVEDYGFAQVSTNITNHLETPVHDVYETVKKIATQYNINVNGSELIGLIPLQALVNAGKYYGVDLKYTGTKELIKLAIEYLGLSSIIPFNPGERIIEYLLGIE
ncbi:MAG: glutamate formimidoyltransferase [Bacteroidales bacterium]|nr:glutamate formimidoyltransferase [Bacteroidales bacterium]